MADQGGDQAVLKAFARIIGNLRTSRIGGHTGDVEYLEGLCRSYIEGGQRIPDTFSPEALTNGIRDKMGGFVREEVDVPNAKRPLYYLMETDAAGVPTGRRLCEDMSDQNSRPVEVHHMDYDPTITDKTNPDYYGIPKRADGTKINCVRKVPPLQIVTHITDGNYPQLTFHYRLDWKDWNDVEFSPKFTKIHGVTYQNPNTTDRDIDPDHVRSLQMVVIPWTDGTYGEDYYYKVDPVTGAVEKNGLNDYSILQKLRAHHGNAGVFHRHERDVKILGELGNQNEHILSYKQINAMHKWADGELKPTAYAAEDFQQLTNIYGGWEKIPDNLKQQRGVMFTQGGKCMVINSQERNILLEKVIKLDSRLFGLYDWKETKLDELCYLLEKFEKQPKGTLKSLFINWGNKTNGRPSIPKRILNSAMGDIVNWHLPIDDKLDHNF